MERAMRGPGFFRIAGHLAPHPFKGRRAVPPLPRPWKSASQTLRPARRKLSPEQEDAYKKRVELLKWCQPILNRLINEVRARRFVNSEDLELYRKWRSSPNRVGEFDGFTIQAGPVEKWFLFPHYFSQTNRLESVRNATWDRVVTQRHILNSLISLGQSIWTKLSDWPNLSFRKFFYKSIVKFEIIIIWRRWFYYPYLWL